MLTPEEFNVILERIRNGTASAEDKDAYRRSLQQSAEAGRIELPSEPVTFNIGEVKGEDVHIGDRITIEQILGQKVIYVSVDEIKTRKFDQVSPYMGLKRFESDDKDRFFGRDQFIKELANELEQTNLILLLGASGSGKSSVVRAGLLSWLSRQWGSRLVSLTFTPDHDPFESLYASLLRYYKQAEAQVAREGREDTLTQVVTTLRRSDAYWFIFIDQFEELFTTSQADKRDRFIADLVRLTNALKLLGSTKDCPVKIVATMRADFLGSFSPYPSLVEATNKHRPLIAEMRVDELRQAIEQPAAQHGVVFETGLVEEIIKDVQGQAGYLPLLQYTLNLVWETEKQSGDLNDRTLNIRTYRELGGVRGALQKRVSQIYAALPEAERLAAQRIFLKLVEIGGDEESGTEWKPVRRRALRSEFDSELEQRVLAKLINENLLVSDHQPQAQESTVEIAHEALLTSWETLNTWIKENRQAIALRNRLNDDVARWHGKKAEDELWTGSKLEQVLELKKNPTFNQVMGGYSATANQFIDASLGLRDRVRKRQVRQARTIATVSIAAVTLVGVAGVVAMLQRQEAIQQRQETVKQKEQAERQSNIAFARQLTAQAEVARNQGGSQLQYSLLLAIESTRRLNNLGITSSEGDAILRYGLTVLPSRIFPSSKESYSTLKNALNSRKIEARKCTGDFKISFNTTCPSPNGKYIAQVMNIHGAGAGSTSIDFLVNIQDVASKQAVAFLPNNNYVNWIAFSQDSRYVMTSEVDGDESISTRIWDLEPEEESSRLIETNSISSFSLDKNGEKLITYSRSYGDSKVDSGLIQIIDPTKKEAIKTKSLTSEYAEISADGRFALTGNGSSLQVIDLNSSSVIMSLDLGIASFSIDGNYVASLNEKSRIVQVVEIATGQVVFKEGIGELTTRLDDNKEKLISVYGGEDELIKNFLNDYFLVSGGKIYLSDTGRVSGTFIWDLLANKITRISSKGRIDIAKFSSSGDYFATWSRFNIIDIFSVADDRLIRRIQNDGRGSGLSFSPDGKYIALSSWNSTVRILDISTGQEIYRLKVERSGKLNIQEISFSPDGKSIAALVSEYKMDQAEPSGIAERQWVKIWSLQTQDLIPQICSRLTRNLSLSEWNQVFGEAAYQKTCPDLPSPEDSQKNTTGTEKSVQSTNQPDVTPIPVVSQPPPPPVDPSSSPTISSSPSPSTSAYKFEFPQASCGDPLAEAGSAFPVFIDDRTVEEIRSKYCADAYPVSRRQKTGKPSVQVASFIDRPKAEAFAREVGGEVGEP